MSLHGDFGETPTVAGTPLGTGGGAPAAHAASHASGGADPVTLAESQVTNLTTDLAAKAPLASPALTGTPTAPTAGGGTNTTQLATTAFVLANAPTATPVEVGRTVLGGRKAIGATALTVWGQAAPGQVGTATSADDADGVWVNLATTAVATNTVGISAASGAFAQVNWLPDAAFRVKTGASVASVGYWMGLSSLTTLPAGTGGAAILAAFRYFTDTDGTAFWACVTKATTTAGTLTATTTTVAVTANTPYVMRVRFPSTTSVEFYLNTALVATHATQVPPATTNLAWLMGAMTLSAATQNVKLGWTWMSHL